MKAITTRFDDETLAKLERFSRANNLTNVESIREAVDLLLAPENSISVLVQRVENMECHLLKLIDIFRKQAERYNQLEQKYFEASDNSLKAFNASRYLIAWADFMTPPASKVDWQTEKKKLKETIDFERAKLKGGHHE